MNNFDLQMRLKAALDNLWDRVVNMFSGLDTRVSTQEQAGYITQETDPTVPSWAKASTKPTYTASEVGAVATGDVANDLTTTAAGKVLDARQGKALKDLIDNAGGGDTNVIEAISFNGVNAPPDANKRVSLTESDPTVPSWAKASAKPAYTAAEVGAIPTAQKGAAGGVAELDSSGHVPSAQLPSYVDAVSEYSSAASFPATGQTGTIYVDTSTNLSYRWSGSTYVAIGQSVALGETSSTAYRGDRGKAAYDHAEARGSLFYYGLYKIQTNAEGHVTGAVNATLNDLTDLGAAAYVQVGDADATGGGVAAKLIGIGLGNTALVRMSGSAMEIFSRGAYDGAFVGTVRYDSYYSQQAGYNVWWTFIYTGVVGSETHIHGQSVYGVTNGVGPQWVFGEYAQPVKSGGTGAKTAPGARSNLVAMTFVTIYDSENTVAAIRSKLYDHGINENETFGFYAQGEASKVLTDNKITGAMRGLMTYRENTSNGDIYDLMVSVGILDPYIAVGRIVIGSTAVSVVKLRQFTGTDM